MTLEWPMAETPTHVMTMAFDPDLDDCVVICPKPGDLAAAEAFAPVYRKLGPEGIRGDLRLYAHVGRPHCPETGVPISTQTTSDIVDKILALPPKTRVLLLAPVVRRQKGEFRDVIDRLAREGFVRVRVDGEQLDLSETISLDKYKRHTIEVVVDRFVVRAPEHEGEPPPDATRLADSIETALRLGEGVVLIAPAPRDKPPYNFIALPWLAQHEYLQYRYTMDDQRLLLIEQPLGYDDIFDHAKLQRELTTPICLDESIHSPDDARRAGFANCRVQQCQGCILPNGFRFASVASLYKAHVVNQDDIRLFLDDDIRDFRRCVNIAHDLQTIPRELCKPLDCPCCCRMILKIARHQGFNRQATQAVLGVE